MALSDSSVELLFLPLQGWDCTEFWQDSGDGARTGYGVWYASWTLGQPRISLLSTLQRTLQMKFRKQDINYEPSLMQNNYTKLSETCWTDILVVGNAWDCFLNSNWTSVETAHLKTVIIVFKQLLLSHCMLKDLSAVVATSDFIMRLRYCISEVL